MADGRQKFRLCIARTHRPVSFAHQFLFDFPLFGDVLANPEYRAKLAIPVELGLPFTAQIADFAIGPDDSRANL